MGSGCTASTPAALPSARRRCLDANLLLRDTLTKTFIDFANDAADFDGFKTRVEAFYNETDADADDWQAAVEQIKSGAAPVPEGVRRCPDPDLYVKVSQKTIAQLTPADDPFVARETQPALSSAA